MSSDFIYAGDPAPSNPPPHGTPSRMGGARRGIAMALLAGGLLVVGGTAVAFAADPSATPAPSDDGTTAPHARPGRGGPDGDCPDKDGSGAEDGGQGGDDSVAPAAPTIPDETTWPEPTLDPADA